MQRQGSAETLVAGRAVILGAWKAMPGHGAACCLQGLNRAVTWLGACLGPSGLSGLYSGGTLHSVG